MVTGNRDPERFRRVLARSSRMGPQGASPSGAWSGAPASIGTTTQGRPLDDVIPDWDCRRVGPVSGRYEGPGDGGNAELELRVDIDEDEGPFFAFNRISGDLFEIDRSFGDPWRIYRASWIVDSPEVVWRRCQVEILGRLRYWHGKYPPTDVRVRIPWGRFTGAGPAEVVFTEAGGFRRSFTCPLTSANLRDVSLELDVCRRANVAPDFPAYGTHDHRVRPVRIPERLITLEEAFRQAGIGVTVNHAQRTDIDDSHDDFYSWSSAELHDAMEDHFSRYRWAPDWNLWALLADRHDDSGFMGLMFDASVVDGAYEPPDRQGFAVFRGHDWFQDLTDRAPENEGQAWAQRLFLFIWVHEAGHAFNLRHSWLKGRPLALSWMNYAWNYPRGADTFWRQFWFSFDDDEILHLRHGDRVAVVMGGDPFGTAGDAEGASLARAVVDGQAPLELLVRSKGSFELMEEARVELRLRNRLPNVALPVDTRLAVEEGRVALYIRRPDGRTVEFEPILCALSRPELRTLRPAGLGEQGEDRYSAEVSLTYGKHGFVFDQPGEYLIRAVYLGLPNPIPSPVHRINVLAPRDAEAASLVPHYFTRQVGLAIALGGSASPYLTEGMEVLATMAERYPDDALGARAAVLVARTEAQPFFRIVDGTVVLHKPPRPKDALALTEAARTFFKDAGAAWNLAYHAVVRERSAILADIGESLTAQKETGTLMTDLEAQGVNRSVLSEIGCTLTGHDSPG